MFNLLYNLITRSLFVLFIAILTVNFLPDQLFQDFPLEPKTLKPVDFNSVIPQWNDKLSAKESKPEFIALNDIIGPESIAISSDGLLYTGLADGRIVELDSKNGHKVRNVLRFNSAPECKDNIATNAKVCGRFLQMRFVNNTLFALEANTGLYKIDVKKGTKTFVGPKLRNKVNLYNSFTFDPKEIDLAYITVTSTKWDLLNILWSILELESSGQLIGLDIKSGKQVVLFSNLMTTNGVDVDATRDQILFSETTLARINSASLPDLRAAFKLAKDGQKLASISKKSLIPTLPGQPDNINVHGDIAYIALPFVKLEGNELVDNMASVPSLRKAIARIIYGSGKILEYIHNNLYQDSLLETAYKELKSGHVIYKFLQYNKAAVIEYNLATGASKFFGSDYFGFISEASPDNKGNIYLGSFRSPFIVKVRCSSST